MISFFKLQLKKIVLFLFIVFSSLLLTAELYFRSINKFDKTFGQNIVNIIKFIYNPPIHADFHYPKKTPEDYTKRTYYQFIENPVYDHEFGYRMTANRESRDILKINNKLLWDVTFKTDEFGRRVTVPSPINKKSEQFVVFYGGSRTFGQGVKDDETLPSNFQKLNPDLKVYNYGIMNAAANIYLRYYEKSKFKKEIPEKKGLFIYIYDLGHEQKILGVKEAVKSFATPFYDYDDNGKLGYFDNFWYGRPIRSTIFSLLGLSAFYQNIFLNKRIDITSLNKNELFLIRDIFLKMQKHSLEMFDSKMVVVFFEVVRSPIMTQVSDILKESGIDVLYFPKQSLPANDNINYYEFDRHPKPVTYQTQAALIQEALKQKSWFKK